MVASTSGSTSRNSGGPTSLLRSNASTEAGVEFARAAFFPTVAACAFPTAATAPVPFALGNQRLRIVRMTHQHDDAVVVRALARDPAERYANAKEFADALELLRIEMRAGRKLNRFRVDFPEAHFWPGKICHDRDAPSRFARCIADSPNSLRVFGRCPV
jgi:hypothetical protein